MAYEKYIKKGGKIYGPYIYESKRVGGKVVSEYHGPREFNYRKFVLIAVGVFFLAALIFFLFSSERGITGRAVFDLNANYQDGEPLEGQLKLSLQEGELIPADSKVIFNNNGNLYEYNLRGLVAEQASSGNFYVQGTEISGAGEGYGIPGQKKIYPKVNFVLSILSPEQQSGQAESTETSEINQTNQATSRTETTTETQTKETESSPITGSAISRFFRLTGNVVAEFEQEILGQVSADEEFRYSLQEGERAEIKPRSVVTESGKQLADNDVSVSILGNELVISTEYFETEAGFGAEYLGSSTKDIIIDVSNLNLVLTPGNLRVSLVDSSQGQEILSLETALSQGTISANKTVEEIVGEPNPIISENVSSNQTNRTIFTPESFELTEAEKTVLASKFGQNYSIEVKEAVERRGFIIIRYELDDYWVENSYPSDLSNETLSLFMERDKIKWLKDIAKSLSASDEPERRLDEFLNSS